MDLGYKLRQDFPIFKNGICYLDSGASSQKPQSVIDKQNYYTEEVYANVHRATYTIAQKITDAYEESRKKIADFINADPKEVIFTKSATEAINLVAHSFGSIIPDGSEIILSEMEHHANIVPWQLLKNRKDISLKIIPVLDNGELDYDEYEKLLTDKTALVAITHISNVLGTIVDIDRIVSSAKKHNAKVLVDGSQAIMHQKVDVKKLGIDFYTFTGHKLYAPTGVGVLWGKSDILNSIPPFLGGGDMIDTVSFEKTTFAEIPIKFEAGTPPIVPAICLGEAIDYISNIGLDKINEYEKYLYKYAFDEITKIKGVRVIGTVENKAPILSFIVEGIHSYDISELMNNENVCVRVGHHCAEPLMKRFNMLSTIRVSLALYNTIDDIDLFINSLKKSLRILG
ncbi:MAG: cysteine desulfurase [Alphaproteobacteria bacterium]|nr:cysteine desulfurase [Alphaproteobacteria bacterium]